MLLLFADAFIDVICAFYHSLMLLLTTDCFIVLMETGPIVLLFTDAFIDVIDALSMYKCFLLFTDAFIVLMETGPMHLSM
jgi:hypothetical protein